MLRVLLVLVLVFSQLQAQKYTLELDIRKRHPTWERSILLGKLTILISEQQSTVESDIDAFHTDLIEPKDFSDEQPIILQFAVSNTNHPAYINRVFMTSVDEITTEPHGQKISIVTGIDSHHININSINYVQTRERVGEIYSQVVKTQQQIEEVFKYQHAARKSQAEEETFFSRYKWPLIIGGVLIYTMLTVDPAKAQSGGQNAS